jgi:hypothetical protein
MRRMKSRFVCMLMGLAEQARQFRPNFVAIQEQGRKCFNMT